MLVLPLETAKADVPAPEVHRTPVVTGEGYFPVACRLQDGRIAVVMRGGAPHIGIKGRLDISFSDDEGKTWSKPTVVIDSEVDDRNPAFGQAKDGTLVVGYWHCNNYDANGKFKDMPHASKTKVTRSTDGGKTWSTPAEIDVSDLDFGSPYGKIVTMPDGAMLMAIYGSAPGGGGKRGQAGDYSYLYRSTDNGQSWSRFSVIGKDRFNETGIVRLDSGDLLAAMRTSAPHQDVWLTRSTDGGKTWSEPTQLTQDKVHPADLTQLPDDRVLVVVGDRRKPYGVRGIVAAPDKLSFANAFKIVDTAAITDCGYPSSVVLKDGRVLTVYYAVGDKSHPDWGTHCGAAVYEVPKP
jgi:Neuraminidase (sialidase)